MRPRAHSAKQAIDGPAPDRPLDISAIAGRLGVVGFAGVETVEHHERRRRPRARVSKTVKVYDPASGRYFSGQACDVSDTGLRLELPAKLPAISGATASVFVAEPGSRPFVGHVEMFPIRFVWVRRNARTGTALCGVEILADAATAREAA